MSGEIATYTANYTISQSSFSSGRVINTVTARGSSPGNNNDVSDVSDDGDDTDGNTADDPTIVLMASGEMAIEATKTAEVTDNGDGEINRGDIITYNIQVENIGETIVTNLSIVDNLSDGDGNILSLNNGPFFTGSDQNSTEGILQPGETASYIAFYIIEQSAADSGKILNSVIASAGTESTSTVSDVSDDGDDADGNTTNDPTEVFIAPDPKIEVVKTAEITDQGDQKIGKGDIITYTIVVTNTGNITLYDLNIVDTITDGNSNELTLSNGPYFSGSSQGSNEGILQVGESATYVAFYIIEAAASETGRIENTVIVIASSPGNINDVTDVSDDGDDTDGNTIDDPTVVEISPSPSIEATKIAEVLDDNADDKTGPGDTINYTITVENTGNIEVTDLNLIDTMTDGNGKPRTLTTGPTYVSSSLNSQRGTLQVGEIANYIASYKIKDSDVEGGRIENSILAIASSPNNSGDVTDVSDNGIDTDDNTIDDPTVIMITYVRKYFEIFNLVTPNGDGLNDYFELRGIENFGPNEVKIYNRWGVLVYETENYGSTAGSDNVFNGYSQGRITIDKTIKLPPGTYYYVIRFSGENPGRRAYSGYLYLNE